MLVESTLEDVMSKFRDDVSENTTGGVASLNFDWGK